MKRLNGRWTFWAIALFILSLGYLLTQPRWIFAIAAWANPGAIYATSPPIVAKSEYDNQLPEKIVALTIDDGPSLATADILAVINRYGAKATFFNIGSNLIGQEETVQQAVNSGHELGNHLMLDEASIRLSMENFETQLQTVELYLSAFLPEGSTLKWLRPGMGLYNAEMVAIAKQNGYQLVLGSNFPYDTHVPFPWFASAFIVSTVQPGDIIVLHDGEGRGARTVETLERVLPALQEKGYTVTTVSELVEASLDAGSQ